MEAPARPVVASVKSPASTPVTGYEKVTVYDTGPAAEGLAEARLIAVTATAGGVTSIGADAAPVPAALVAATEHAYNVPFWRAVIVAGDDDDDDEMIGPG